MSIYKRFGAGPFVQTDTKIDLENIDLFYHEAEKMNAQVGLISNVLSLQQKILTGDPDYSKEYLLNRLEKLRSQAPEGIFKEVLVSQTEKLQKVIAALKVQLPIAMDKVRGRDSAEQEKMSALDDERIRTEDALVAAYKEQYPLFHEVLPKIFYLIIDGCEFATVSSCFLQLKKVLAGDITSKTATQNLMDESVSRYNLPSGFWNVQGQGAKGAK